MSKQWTGSLIGSLTIMMTVVAALIALPGCGSGHAPTYTDASGKQISLWQHRLEKICSSPRALNINGDTQDTVQKLQNDNQNWVVRTVLVSDSLAANVNSGAIAIYQELPQQNTGAQLVSANAQQINSPDLMHVTMNCQSLTATYFGPGVNSPNGVTGKIKEPNDQWIDDAGDLTRKELYISGGTDPIMNSQGQTIGIPVDIHIKKLVPDWTDPTVGGENAWKQEQVEENEFGMRNYKITITQTTPAGKRTLVIMQTVNMPNDTAVKMDSDVAANYLQVLPKTYIQQVMMKSQNANIKSLGAALGDGADYITRLRAAGTQKFSMDMSVLEEARSALLAAASTAPSALTQKTAATK